MMPGLPGVSVKQDINTFKQLFNNEDFRPDALKIYPCMVIQGTELYKLWKKKKYKPLTTAKAAQMMVEIKKHIPDFEVNYKIDATRQAMADSWPNNMDDSAARQEWGWQPKYTLSNMVEDMLQQLAKKLNK